MTDAHAARLRAVLSAAPTRALRRLLRQPLRLWKAGIMYCGDRARCLVYTIEDARQEDGVVTYRDTCLSRRSRSKGVCGFDSSCETDGLPATVAAVKRMARQELQRRG